MLKKSNLILLIAGVIIGAVTVYWFLLQGQKTNQNVTTNIPPTASEVESTPTYSVHSTLIPTTSSQKGIIEGSMGYPSEGIPPEIIVCAENINTKEEYCTDKRINNSKYTYRIGYTLEVPVGSYHVYERFSSAGEGRAYYSEFVTCGLSSGCLSHKPITVEVKAGQTIDKIDPQDWYN